MNVFQQHIILNSSNPRFISISLALICMSDSLIVLYIYIYFSHMEFAKLCIPVQNAIFHHQREKKCDFFLAHVFIRTFGECQRQGWSLYFNFLFLSLSLALQSFFLFIYYISSPYHHNPLLSSSQFGLA